MIDYLLVVVYIVFFSQVVVISFWVSYVWRNNLSSIYKQYSQAEYPKFYCQPVETLYRQLLVRKCLDFIIGSGCLVLIVFAFFQSTSTKSLANMMFFCAMAQIIPFFVSGYWEAKSNRLRRQNQQPTRRKAQLIARRLGEFVSPWYTYIAVSIFFVSMIVGLYVFVADSWGPSNYSVLALLALSLCVNIFLVSYIYKNLYGKSSDQYIQYSDKLKKIAFTIRRLVFLSISYSFFVITILIGEALAFGDIATYLFTSVYMQIVLSLETKSAYKRDFNVYKAEDD